MKKCTVCREEFNQFNSLTKVCSPKCALELVKVNKDKKLTKQWKQEKKEWIAKNTPQRTHKKRAQDAFNLYIRMRDYNEPCVSCGKCEPYTANQWDAGHYIAVGSCNSLRFNTKNCFKQCKRCNSSPPRGLNGNYPAYRKRLIARFGEQHVIDLEDYQDIKPMGTHYFNRIQKIFNKKARIQKNRVGI